METSEQLQRQQLIGVLLTSMGALALEVVLTRIFSVTMWYHFAFLAISLALMGSGTAGVVLYAFPRLAQPEVARRWIGYLAVLIGLCVPLTFFIYLQIPFRPVLMNRTGWFSSGQVLWLLLIYLDLALPFFLSGMILSLALSGWPADAGRIYWADLTGASLGCLASIAALAWLGGAGAVLAVGAVLALAGVAFTHGWALLRPGASQASGPKAKVVRVGALVLCLALVAAGTTNAASPWLHIRVNKAGGVEQPAVYERWNAHSRVTVYDTCYYPFFWGVSPARWQETVDGPSTFAHTLLLIDAVAGTPIQAFNGDLSLVRFLRYDLTSLVYHLLDAPRTLVIGPGGGRDVLAALASDAPFVTAVEVNPAVIDAVRGPFADFAGHLYDRPDVEVVVADARGYIERSPTRYDVIQASLIDTWAAGGSGAFALSENSLYTREAFEGYYRHLSDRGYLTVSRWYLPGRPAETLRLVSTGMAGWAASGVVDPRDHVAVVSIAHSGAQTEGLATALFKRTPFTEADSARLVQAAQDLGFNVIYVPHMATQELVPSEEVGTFIAGPDHAGFVAAYALDISPATDNRPFFFNLVLLGDLLDDSLSGSGVYRTSMEAILILFAVIGVSLVFGVGLMGVLMAVSARRSRQGVAPARPSAALLGYFCALGLAFMLIEIPTIQKFTVYLGRPVYSLAVVLFALLLFSGLGSLWSGRWPEARVAERIRQAFAALFVVVLVHPILSGAVLQATLGWALGPRMGVAVLLIGVLGFLMGIPFPTGIRWAGTHRPGVVPWLWAINGVASVLGSALATALAIHLGFRATAALAAVIYGAAGLLLSAELVRGHARQARIVLRLRRGPEEA